MYGIFNFQKLHQGYWGVINLSKVFIDFKLRWAVIGAHDHGGLFLFWMNEVEGFFFFDINL
jgi:hypothetical protein